MCYLSMRAANMIFILLSFIAEITFVFYTFVFYDCKIIGLARMRNNIMERKI